MSAAEMPLETRVRALVADLGLGRAEDVENVRPLTGGVASDIAAVTLKGRIICVKFALPKLRVAADWRAPVHRNRAEYYWLTTAAAIAPDAVPTLLGWSAHENGFAMEFLTGDDLYLWKTAMLAGHPPRGEAAAVGAVLGKIHAASAAPGFDRTPFDNADDFHALRLEPYLLFTATRHPDLASAFTQMADALYASRVALVHGDVSPKNIFLRGGRPVLLDAECATMGDPAFDVAFCLNHLLLKAVHVKAIRPALLAAIPAFVAAYSAAVNWEDPAALEARVAALLPLLFLARVDGKSPVEYLDDGERAEVRALGRALVLARPATVAGIVALVTKELGA